MSSFDECQGIKVYRFQPCFETDGSLRGEKISNDSLWFSTPKHLNDPMDIDHPFDDLMRNKGGDSPVLREMAKVMYALGQDKYPRQLITDDLRDQILNWANNGGDSLNLCDEFKSRSLQLGVACFTPSWDNPPMWSHYANNGQGFAIEYCIHQMDIAKSDFYQFWVNYSSRINITSLSELLFSPYEAFSRILGSKTLPWSYEQEWRLVHVDGGDKFVNTPFGMKMTGIVLGFKSPDKQTTLLKKRCEEWELPLLEVSMSLSKTLRLREIPNK